MSEHDITVGLTTIVVLGVGAQWIARRLGFPALLLLLPAGLAAGATGLVDPEGLLGDTLVPLATLLVALLLFQAGLNLRLDELPRPARGPVARLVTIGLLVTFAGAAATLLLLADVPPEVAVVTAAVLTHGAHQRLRRNPRGFDHRDPVHPAGALVKVEDLIDNLPTIAVQKG